MRATRLCVAALLVTLSACSGGSGTERTAIPASSTTPRSFTLDGQPMLPCGADAAVCGHLSVPEDRSDPDGRQIDFYVKLVPAVASDPQPDPVFFLAGGPGGAATQSWLSAPGLFPIVHWDRDIVLVDQRGTGDSNLLLWPEPPDLSGLSRHEMSVTLAAWLKKALAGLDADPRFYASRQAADDLDDVRAALGYDRIDIYGASYGATLAQYYLRQHESHVRSVVLDGGTLLDVPIFERLPRSSQAALDSVLERCVADTACHATFPDPAGDLETRDGQVGETSGPHRPLRPVDRRADRGGRRSPRGADPLPARDQRQRRSAPASCTRRRPDVSSRSPSGSGTPVKIRARRRRRR